MSKRIRVAEIYIHGILAATLTQEDTHYCVQYYPEYQGPPISLTLPVRTEPYNFNTFPAFFDGLLPEGPQLEALLKQAKLDRNDYFGQLMQVGHNLVGAVNAVEKSHE